MALPPGPRRQTMDGSPALRRLLGASCGGRLGGTSAAQGPRSSTLLTLTPTRDYVPRSDILPGHRARNGDQRLGPALFRWARPSECSITFDCLARAAGAAMFTAGGRSERERPLAKPDVAPQAGPVGLCSSDL